MSRKYLSRYKISFSQTSPWCLNPDVTVFACPESYADRAHMLVMLHVGGFIPLPLFPHCKTLPLPQFFLRKYENTNPQFTGCKSNQLVPALLLELPLNIRAFTSRRYANINYMSSMYEVLLVFFPINQRVWITSRGSHTHIVKYPILEVARARNV